MAEEHLFYIAGAAVVGVTSMYDYKLWLIDGANKEKFDQWLAGGKVPESECVPFRSNLTFESRGSTGEFDTVGENIAKRLETRDDKRLYGDVWTAGSYTTVTVLVSEHLWNRLAEQDKPWPAKHRPVPPAPYPQPYRVQLLARKDNSAKFRYYFGFHAKVIGTASSGLPIVQFYDWDDIKLGADEVNLASNVFEPQGKYTKIAPSPKVGEEGALFVALDSFLPFLDAPKVPAGAGEHHLSALAEPGRRVSDATHSRSESAPIVVASGAAGDWLDAARDEVIGEGIANDEDGVAREITRLLDSVGDRGAIELLSHSDDDNLLTFEGWTMDLHAFTAQSKAFKDRLIGKQLRLVGCSTARGTKAKKVLRALEQHLGVKAFGTRGLFGTFDLSTEGSEPSRRAALFREVDPNEDLDLAAEDVFRVTEEDLARGGEPVAFPSEEDARLLAGLDAASRSVLEQVLEMVPPQSYPFPGMLRKPSVAFRLVPAERNGLDGWIDALFHGELIRISRGRRHQAERIDRLFWVQDPKRQATLMALLSQRR